MAALREDREVGDEIRRVCRYAVEMVLIEGLEAEDDWLTTRTGMTFDEWGQVILSADYGVIPGDGPGCEPCAEQGGDFGLAGRRGTHEKHGRR